MRIVIGADHAGFPLKKTLTDYIRHLGHHIVDVGTNGTDAVDYPDYAEEVSKTLIEGKQIEGVPDLWQRGRGLCSREQDTGYSRRAMSRHVFGAPGSRTRRHECSWCWVGV